MPLSDLLDEALGAVDTDCWVRDRTATPEGVRRPPPFCGALAARDVAILDLLGVDRSHGAIWEWTHRLADDQYDPPRSTPRRIILIICETVCPVPDRSVRAVNAEELENRNSLAEREPRRMESDGERPDGRRRPLTVPTVTICRL